MRKKFVCQRVQWRVAATNVHTTSDWHYLNTPIGSSWFVEIKCIGLMEIEFGKVGRRRGGFFISLSPGHGSSFIKMSQNTLKEYTCIFRFVIIMYKGIRLFLSHFQNAWLPWSFFLLFSIFFFLPIEGSVMPGSCCQRLTGHLQKAWSIAVTVNILITGNHRHSSSASVLLLALGFSSSTLLLSR